MDLRRKTKKAGRARVGTRPAGYRRSCLQSQTAQLERDGHERSDGKLRLWCGVLATLDPES